MAAGVKCYLGRRESEWRGRGLNKAGKVAGRWERWVGGLFACVRAQPTVSTYDPRIKLLS